MPVVDGNWFAPDKAWLNTFPGQKLFRVVKGRGGKDFFIASEVEKAYSTPIHNLQLARGLAMDIEQHAVEVSGAADEALKALKATLDKFRSTIANDLTSMKAASSRVQSETLQMRQAYQAAQELLTSDGFERAVVNAERMANALKSIRELSDTNLNVTLFSGTNKEAA